MIFSRVPYALFIIAILAASVHPLPVSDSILFTMNETHISIPFNTALRSKTIFWMMESSLSGEWVVPIPLQMDTLVFQKAVNLMSSNDLDSKVTLIRFNLSQLVELLKLFDFLYVSDLYDMTVDEIRHRIVNSDEDLTPLSKLNDHLLFYIFKRNWEFSQMNLYSLVQIWKFIDYLNLQDIANDAIIETRKRIEASDSVEIDLTPLLNLSPDIMKAILSKEWDLDYLVGSLPLKCIDLGQRTVGTFILENLTKIKTSHFAYFISVASCLKSVSDMDLIFHEIEKDDAEILLNSTIFQNLKRLKLQTNDQGLLLITSQEFNHLEELEIHYSRLALDAIDSIAHSSILRNLCILHFNNVNLGDEGINIIFQSKNLNRLEELRLKSTMMGANGAKTLATCPRLNHLKVLHLEGNRIGREGAEYLAASPILRNLEELNLDYCSIRTAGVIAITTFGNIGYLKNLSLAYNHVCGKGVGAIAACARMQHLEVLNLSDNQIRVKGARAIASSKYLKQLKHLNLDSNFIGDVGVSSLASSPNLQHMEVLNLRGNLISDTGAIAIASSEYMTHLMVLDLSSNDIGERGASSIVKSLYLQSLKNMNLTGNKIGDGGAIAIAHSQNMQNLQVLDLMSNGIGIEGALAIASSSFMRNLKVLELSNNRIGYEGVNALANSEFLCGVRYYIMALCYIF